MVMDFRNKSDSKNILIISPSFFPSIYGGISTALHPLVLELSEHFSCSVITTNFKILETDKVELNKWIYKENYKIIYANYKYSLYVFQVIYHFLNSLNKADVIYINSLFFPPNIFLGVIAKICNKKILWSIHGELSIPALKMGFYKKKIFLFFYKIISKRITYIASSDLEKVQIIKRLKSNEVLVIPNLVKLNRATTINKKQQFVFLGRISPIKKIENLILGFNNFILKNNSDYILCIVGGYDKKDLEYYLGLNEMVKKQNLEKHVLFIPEVKSPQKENILAESKFLFLVSDSENFGNVVVESLFQGTPVIASYGTPWKILSETNSGFWVDNSVESIQKIILQISKINENEYNFMVKNAKLLAEQFSSDKILEKWITLINK
jgi:glycosyltransferase involved in cell wall biosynthesis